MSMNFNEAFRSQSLAERVEGIMCGDLIVVYTDSITIDFDFGKFLAEFPIGGNMLLDFENACQYQ